MIIDQLFEAPQQCPECGGISFSDLILAEKKDACYHKVKASAKVWPSAYASGRLVQCRKKGAANYGNKSEGVAEGMDSQVVFSGTGADGGTYEIIQSSPTDFMIHANGKHIDTYGSLQRAMSVLQNEVPGLQQGVVEGWRDIYNLNKQKIGTNPNLIKPDTVLKMPDGSRYKVKPGDNLSSIAKTSGAKSTPAKSKNSTAKPAVEPKYYSLPPAAVKPAAVKPAPAAQDDSPYTLDVRSGKVGVKPDRIADVFQNNKPLPALTRDEIEQQMMQPDFGGPQRPGYKHIVTGQDGEEHQFDSGEEAKDFVKKIQQLRLQDLEQGGLGAAKSESISGTVKEVSLGDYRKKAQLSQAGAKINKFFDRDNPTKVAAADRTISKREKGLSRADARSRPYTAPPVDKEKQRQQLTDKYPNIDELVRRAEVNRDPDYEYADGQAYYDGQEAEQNYVRLKQIQRIIQGLNEETRQATLNTPAGDFTADITKDKSTNTVSGKMNVRGVNIGAVKDMTPGGAQSVSADMDVAPGLNISATRKSADYNKGQLAGTKSVSAKYTDTAGALGQPGQQHTATRTAGVGFGGASGPRVGKNYVTQIDKTLADYMKEAKGINSIRNPYDLQPLEAGGGGGGGGGRTTSGPSPFGPKPGSREASIAQPNPNTMTIKQGPNPDYRPPSQQSQTSGDKPKIKVNPGETVPQAIERTKTQQEFGKFLQGQSGQTFGAGAGRGSVNPAPANTMANTPVSVKNKPSAMNSVARDLTNPPKPNNTNTTTTTTNNSPRQNDRVDPLDMPRGPYMPRDPFDMVRPGYDGQLGSNPMPNTRDKQSSWLGKAGKTLGYGAAAYGAADVGSRAWDYYDQNYSDVPYVPSVKEAKKQPPEVEYDDEYDAMVARVKKLAGLGPMKTVYDPKKRQYRNMPTAQQPKK